MDLPATIERAWALRLVFLFGCMLIPTHGSCVRYDCSLDFLHTKHHEFDEHGTLITPKKDKPVFVCENYPYDLCGPGQKECSGHCNNIPGKDCEDNSDCVEEPKPAPAPAPLAAAPLPAVIHVPVPGAPQYIPAPVPAAPVPPTPRGNSDVCWDVSFENKEECSRLGHGTGQCYWSRDHCYRSGGEQFLEGHCGHMALYEEACGCCIFAGLSIVTVEPEKDEEKHHHWPTPQPTGCCQQFALTDRQILLILFLVYLVFNSIVILLSRCCIRSTRGKQSQQHGGGDKRGSYSKVEDGSGAEHADDEDPMGESEDAPGAASRKRHQRGDPADDCCQDFRWWEVKAWVWLLVEALVLPCVVVSLCCCQGGRRKAQVEEK